jgi:peptide/nickel transport system substrate-binding protein
MEGIRALQTRRQFLVRAGGVAGTALAAGTLLEILEACGQPTTTTTPQLTSLSFTQGYEPISLQPDINVNLASDRVEAQIFEGATKYIYSGSVPKLVPWIAQSWSQVSPSVWRFKIRPGVKFSNGEALDANSFKFGLDTYYADKNKGIALLPKILIAVVDSQTFDVTTPTKNLAPLPAWMSILFPYPPMYYAAKGAAGFLAAPIGTGPYMLDNWQKGVAITLVANPHYWGTKPSIPKVVFKYVLDESTRVSQLETGETDIIGELSPQVSGRIAALTNARLVTKPSAQRAFLGLSMAVAPTDNVLVRRALNYAIDKDAIVKSLFKGQAQVLRGIYQPGETGYDPTFTGYKYDPVMAKQLLAQAGHPNGLTLDFHYAVGWVPLDKETAEAIQAQLRAVGITTNMIPLTATQILQYYASKKATGLTFYTANPPLTDSAAIVQFYLGGNAIYKYHDDPKQDQMEIDALEETDATKRNALYTKFEKYVMDAAEWVPLYSYVSFYGISKKVAWEPPSGSDIAPDFASAKGA